MAIPDMETVSSQQVADGTTISDSAGESCRLKLEKLDIPMQDPVRVATRDLHIYLQRINHGFTEFHSLMISDAERSYFLFGLIKRKDTHQILKDVVQISIGPTKV